MQVEEGQNALAVMEGLVKACVDTCTKIQSFPKSHVESSDMMDKVQKSLRQKTLYELRRASITLLPFTLWGHREKLKRFKQLDQ